MPSGDGAYPNRLATRSQYLERRLRSEALANVPGAKCCRTTESSKTSAPCASELFRVARDRAGTLLLVLERLRVAAGLRFGAAECLRRIRRAPTRRASPDPRALRRTASTTSRRPVYDRRTAVPAICKRGGLLSSTLKKVVGRDDSEEGLAGIAPRAEHRCRASCGSRGAIVARSSRKMRAPRARAEGDAPGAAQSGRARDPARTVSPGPSAAVLDLILGVVEKLELPSRSSRIATSDGARRSRSAVAEPENVRAGFSVAHPMRPNRHA